MKVMLWFDVGIKRYTTFEFLLQNTPSCGLMQESKDIQRHLDRPLEPGGCGLMQESKDIQLLATREQRKHGCGLMQESKDIQLAYVFHTMIFGCGLMQESKDIQRTKWIIIIIYVVV